MVYELECSLDKQDCATLYNPPPGGPFFIPFTDHSCIRDDRLEGNVGRCGFPGAPCSVDSKGQDNCGGGNTNTTRSLCQNGQCGGGPGAPCKSNIDCNWGIQCNGNGSVCGGFGAYLNDNETKDGLDVASDYCLSGKMFQNKDGWYQCQGGPTKGLTSPPSSLSTATIAAVAASVLLLVVIAFITWCCKCKGRQKKSGKIMYLVPLDQGELE